MLSLRFVILVLDDANGTDIAYKMLYEQSQLSIASLQHELDQLKKMIFGSMAHARRMFFEAQGNDLSRATYAMEHIQKLYSIEHKAKQTRLDVAQVLHLRKTESIPILETLGNRMKEQYVQTLPKSPIGKALGYSIERWNELMIYTTDGKLNIDNNPVENSIRPVAIGRKNYLFAGSHEAAQRKRHALLAYGYMQTSWYQSCPMAQRCSQKNQQSTYQ